MTELNKGDFLYQSDQELFLVVTGETDDGYTFAVHGWREIGEDRLDEYIEDSRSKVHRQDNVEQIIMEKGDDNTEKQFNKLKQLFSVYEQANLPSDGPSNEFTLKDK